MKRILLTIILAILGFSDKSFAQGDLLITPKRVVFEGNKLREPLNLVNIGKDTTTYSISFLEYNMREDGSFVTVDSADSGQMFANPFLRIFPRNVTLVPGEPQVIMLQCRRNSDMKQGEYRSHLYFRAEKDFRPLGTKNKIVDTTQLSVQLTPVYGISIPIIIRSGSVNVSSSLSDLKLDNQQDGVQYLKITINRAGNISVYGDIIIEFVPLQGKSYQVGAVNGVGVYTNITRRNISVKLNDTSGDPSKKGKLRVQYVSNGQPKRTTYAEAYMDINE